MEIIINIDDLVNDFIQNSKYDECGPTKEFKLKKELKEAIIRSVTYHKFDKEIEDMREKAQSLFKTQISENIKDIVEKHVKRIIREDKFKYHSYDKEEITLSEYIKNRYLDYIDKVNLDKITKEIAKEHANSLKERYDVLFASQLVSKLDQLGMLKDDAAKILLSGNKEQL